MYVIMSIAHFHVALHADKVHYTAYKILYMRFSLRYNWSLIKIVVSKK